MASVERRAPSTSSKKSSSWDLEGEIELLEQEELLVLQQVPSCSQSVILLHWLDCLVAYDLTPHVPRLLRRVKELPGSEVVQFATQRQLQT